MCLKTVSQIQTLIVTLLGVAMITQPPFLFNHGQGSQAVEANSSSNSSSSSDTGGTIVYNSTYFWMAGLVLLGNCFQV